MSIVYTPLQSLAGPGLPAEFRLNCETNSRKVRVDEQAPGA
jgi:hypothetical protein